MITLNTRTRSGLPIYVEAEVAAPEPDVGLFAPWVDYLAVYFEPRGKRLYPIPETLLERERDGICEKVLEEAHNAN